MVADELVPYEQLREANMRRNLSIMAGLGIAKDLCALESSTREQNIEPMTKSSGKRKSQKSATER